MGEVACIIRFCIEYAFLWINNKIIQRNRDDKRHTEQAAGTDLGIVIYLDLW
jgi:hypothetical protein